MKPAPVAVAFIAAALCLLVTMFASIAFAEQAGACAPRADIVAHLERKYGETRRGAGLQTRGSVTEIFVSAENGSWTIIVTRPDGVACAVAAGEAWMDELAPAPGRDG